MCAGVECSRQTAELAAAGWESTAARCKRSADDERAPSIAGAGINMAQRVMDCGDAGHILLSQHVADDLVQYRQWAPRLRDLGECEVKHGVRLHLVNLYAEPLGNAAVPQKFQQTTPKPRPKSRRGAAVSDGSPRLVLVAILAAGAAYYFTRIDQRRRAPPFPKNRSPCCRWSIPPAIRLTSTSPTACRRNSSLRSRVCSDLKVIGRTSSFQFKGKTDDSKTIGEKLGVYYLLEGSVRKSADRVRIAVALIKSGDGANVWSETYDRELKDIFAVQSEIAGAVAKELKVALLGNNGQTAQLATAATPSNQNVEAYNALLQGNFYYNRRTAEDTRKAIGYYEEAIRLDPRYALAYAKLSIAAANLATSYGSIATKEGEEAIAKARASAKRALELDPNLADAHSAQGAISEDVDFNFAGAEAEYRRALELAPQNAAVMANLANLLAKLGRLDEAVALAQRAIALEPLRSAFHHNLALYLTALGRYDEAEAALRKAIELQPQSATNYVQLAIIQILRGKSGAAVELAKQETDPFWRTYALALAHFANGDRAEADAALKKLIDENADDGGSQIAHGLCPAQGTGQDVRVAGARLDHARRRCDRAAGQSLPARLQGRPALHRLRAKDRGHAESRSPSRERQSLLVIRPAADRLCARRCAARRSTGSAARYSATVNCLAGDDSGFNVPPYYIEHPFCGHRGDCARAARARTQMFRRSLQSSTASLTEIRLRLRPRQTR